MKQLPNKMEGSIVHSENKRIHTKADLAINDLIDAVRELQQEVNRLKSTPEERQFAQGAKQWMEFNKSDSECPVCGKEFKFGGCTCLPSEIVNHGDDKPQEPILGLVQRDKGCECTCHGTDYHSDPICFSRCYDKPESGEHVAITRFEYIDYTEDVEHDGGRQVIVMPYNEKMVSYELQDGGRTLKVFIRDKEPKK